MPLQFWITGVMMVAMIETTMLYFHFIDWNEVRNVRILFSCVLGIGVGRDAAQISPRVVLILISRQL